MKYVVIGSSAAGVNAVRELRKRDKEGQMSSFPRIRIFIPAVFSMNTCQEKEALNDSDSWKLILKTYIR